MGVWHVKTLIKIGFGTLADRPPSWEFQRGGLEEVPTAALLQMIHQYMSLRADEESNDNYESQPYEVKLVMMPSELEWQVDFSSPLRRDRHQRKIDAKKPHGDDLMNKIGLHHYGNVKHVVPSSLRHTLRTPVRIG
jgi:hypothetical protein